MLPLYLWYVLLASLILGTLSYFIAFRKFSQFRKSSPQYKITLLTVLLYLLLVTFCFMFWNHASDIGFDREEKLVLSGLFSLASLVFYLKIVPLLKGLFSRE